MCKLSEYGNCDPDTENQEYCIFHKPEKTEEEEDEFWRKFFEKFKPKKEKIEISGKIIERLVFEGDVDCRGYVFPHDLQFEYAIFKGEANFSEAKFLGDADFSDAKFSGEADFSKAEFSNANFPGAEFSDADFFFAKFLGNANFIGAKFSYAYFPGAKFSDADFFFAKFSDADFSDAKFLGNANFFSAEFSDADFSKAEFSDANFIGAKFSYAYFRECKFDKKARFDYAEFLGTADFSKAKFPDTEDLTDFVSFWNVYFKNQRRVYFDGMEGGARVSFINTDISRVVFRNCDLDSPFDEVLLKEKEEIERKVKKLEKSGKEDELKLLKLELEDLEDVTLDNVLAVIRNLRENCDYYLRYEEAGRLFIREMELKRNHVLSRRSRGEGGSTRGMRSMSSLAQKISGLIEWLAYTIYKYIGLYGESIARPIAWAIFFIIFFGLIRLSTGCSLSSCMWESFTAFMQMRWDESLLTALERMISVLNLGILYTSLQRKLRRRIRH